MGLLAAGQLCPGSERTGDGLPASTSSSNWVRAYVLVKLHDQQYAAGKGVP